MSYSKIHEQSKDSVDPSLDLFSVPATLTSVLEGSSIEIDPIRQPNGKQIDFTHKTSGNVYWDPVNTFLVIQFKVTLADGAPIGDAGAITVMPDKFLGGSLFQGLEISLGNKVIVQDNELPFRTYLDKALGKGMGHKLTAARTEMWLEDSIGVADRSQHIEDMKDDILARKSIIANSKIVEVVLPIPAGIFKQPRFIIPGVELKFRFTRSDPSICLMKTDADDNNNYKIEFTKCCMNVRQVTTHPAIPAAQEDLLRRGKTAKVPHKRTEIHPHTIAQGKQSDRINIRSSQQTPLKFIFGLLDHDTKQGSWDKSIHNFKHKDIESFGLTVNGQSVPPKHYEMDFSTGRYTLPYYNLASASGAIFNNTDNGITMEQFGNGHTLFAIDLTPDSCQGSGAHLIKDSTITLDIKFKQPLAETITIIVCSVLSDLLEITHERQALLLPPL